MNIQERQRQFNIERPIMSAHDTPQRTLGLLRGEVDEVEAELTTMHPEPPHRATEELGKELADCLIYLMVLANNFGIDLIGVTHEKISYNERRFPKDMFQEGDFMEQYKACKIAAGEWKDMSPGVDYTLLRQ